MKKSICVLLAVLLLLSALTACSKSAGETVNVQSVAMLCGLGGLGTAERFSGVVSARSETKIEKDENKTIAEILVKEGDLVTAGQVLFSYDMEYAELQLEKAQLELEQLRNDIVAKETQKAQLEKEKKTVYGSAQLSYSIEIQACDTAIREDNYNISMKEKEILRLEESLKNLDVTSPVNGRIRSLNESTSYDNYGNTQPFMTVMETGAYRVMGYINENNAGALMEGMSVIVRSRVDDTVWTGYVAMIDWANPSSSTNPNYYYGGSDDGMQNSSKYPFYVELDDSEGLLLGQHVYIEPGAAAEGAGMKLPAYYLAENNGSNAVVWAENTRGKLEKRVVALGTYDEASDSWEILSGLSAEDYIAWPDDNLSAGMTCVEFDETAFEGDFNSDENFFVDGETAVEYIGEGDAFEQGGYAADNDFTVEITEGDITPEADDAA